MKQYFNEFKKFISRGNVVDMAVGVAVASAFTSVVNAFTKGVISPLIALVTDTSHLDEAKWVIREEVLEGEEVIIPEVSILWGSILQAIINFILVATVLYTVMKISASIRRHAEKLRNNVVNRLTDADERAAEEEAKLKAEAEEAEKARILAEEEAKRALEEKEAAKEARLEREEALLTEIRDLLKNK
jgi:large conductance mechanosensitive channel